MLTDYKQAPLIFKAGIMKDQSNFLLWEGNWPPRKGQAADGNLILMLEWCSHSQSWLSPQKMKARQPRSHCCEVGTQFAQNNAEEMVVSNSLSSRKDTLNRFIVIPEGFNMDISRWIRWYTREYVYIIYRWNQSASTRDNRLQMQNDGFQKWPGINKMKFNKDSARQQSGRNQIGKWVQTAEAAALRQSYEGRELNPRQHHKYCRKRAGVTWRCSGWKFLNWGWFLPVLLYLSLMKS